MQSRIQRHETYKYGGENRDSTAYHRGWTVGDILLRALIVELARDSSSQKLSKRAFSLRRHN